MVTAIVLTRDRPAQANLLYRSIYENARGVFELHEVNEPAGPAFQQRIERLLEHGGNIDPPHDFACFMCDDAIVYRPLPATISLAVDELCFSLRLGRNTVVQYPTGHGQAVPFSWSDDASRAWLWNGAEGDFGYPGSIDGHVFRRAELLEMLNGQQFPNPTALECVLVDGCERLRERRPMMACFAESVYVGVPVNRVSEQSNVRFGERFPQPAEEMTKRFEAGERLDLDAIDFTHVNGAHTELELPWKTPVSA